jgi:hypothetical protein
MNDEVESELVKRLQITALMISLGVHPIKAAHGLYTELKELSQRGTMSLEEMTRVRATLGAWTDEYADGWAKGYAEGWAAAVVRVLEQRDVPSSDEIHGYISTRTDLKILAHWLDLAATVTSGEDLIRPDGKDHG